MICIAKYITSNLLNTRIPVKAGTKMHAHFAELIEIVNKKIAEK